MIPVLIGLALVAFFVGCFLYLRHRQRYNAWRRAYIAANPAKQGDPPYTSAHLRMLYDRQVEKEKRDREAEERAKSGKTLDPKGREVPADEKQKDPPPPPPPPGTTVGGTPYRRK